MNRSAYRDAYKEGYRAAIAKTAIMLSQYSRTVPQKEIAQMMGISVYALTTAIKQTKRMEEMHNFSKAYEQSRTRQNTIDLWKLFMNVIINDIPLSQMSKYCDVTLDKVHEMINRYNKYAIYKLYPFMPKEKLPSKPDPLDREILQKILKYRLAKYGKSGCLL